MPGGDRTGPAGMGPMTGRAAGYCAGYPVPGYMNPVGGRGYGGFGFGRGRGGGGWGRRNWFYATGLTGWQRAAAGYPDFGGIPTPAGTSVPFARTVTGEQQLDALKGQAEYFKEALEDISRQIQELESKSKKNKD